MCTKNSNKLKSFKNVSEKFVDGKLVFLPTTYPFNAKSINFLNVVLITDYACTYDSLEIKISD